MPVIRAVGSIKRLGGTGFQGHFWILKRAPKKFFPEMLATMGGGGGGEKLYYTQLYCTFLTNFFLKTLKFPNKKGTFHVNLVFTATLACTKRALFITKKGHFWSFEKIGGGGGTCPHAPPPPVPTPLPVMFL